MRGYRAVNILVHIGCAIWVALLARALLSRLPRPHGARQRSWMALLAGLLFVAHPLQVQSVTYVVQRMNSLAAFFYLAALLAWLRGRIARDSGSRAAWWSGAALLGALALGSKEIAVTLPLAIWGVEWFFFRDLDRRFALRSALFGGLPLLAVGIWLAASLLPELGLGYAGRSFSAGERLLTELRVVAFYAGLVLLPLPSRLNLLHEFSLSASWLEPITTLLSAVMLAASLGLAAFLARRAPLLSFGILWFWLHLVIESFGLPLALVYEHRTYLPLAGVAIAAGWGIFSLPGVVGRRAVPLGLAIVFLLGIGTLVRNHVWDDSLRLWSDVARKSPGISAAHSNLANAWVVAEQPDRAAVAFRRALELDPGNVEAHNNLGSLQLGARDLAGAMASFRAALELAPGHVRARHNLGIALAEAGNLEEGVREIELAISRDPLEARMWNTLGAMQVRLQRLDDAGESFTRAVRLDPAYIEAQSNLRVLQRMKADRAAQQGGQPAP